MVYELGVSWPTLMSGAHWCKANPEGVSNNYNDESVLNFGTTRRKSEKNPWNPDSTYSW